MQILTSGWRLAFIYKEIRQGGFRGLWKTDSESLCWFTCRLWRVIAHLSAGKLHNSRLLSEERRRESSAPWRVPRCTGTFGSTGLVCRLAYVHVCMFENWVLITRCFHSSTSLKFPLRKKERHCSSVAICYFYFLLLSSWHMCWQARLLFSAQLHWLSDSTAAPEMRILLLSKGTQPLFHKSLKHVYSISRRHH